MIRRVRVAVDARGRGGPRVLVGAAALARSSAGICLQGAGRARHARVTVRAGVAGVAEARIDIAVPCFIVRGVCRALHTLAGVVDICVRARRTHLTVHCLRHGQTRYPGTYTQSSCQIQPAEIVSLVCTQKLRFPYMYHTVCCPRLHRSPWRR